MGIRVESPAFGPNQSMPARFTADGENLSPPLRLGAVPPKARELAIICEDPDAPRPEPFVHWVMYKIPPDTRMIPESLANASHVRAPKGALQGTNDFGTIGYAGPKPPDHKPHHYHFRVLALDCPIDEIPGLREKDLLASTAGHVLDEGELVGVYQH